MISKETKFAIVGLGLMGGSYALGLTQAGYLVYGIDQKQEVIDYALSHQMINEGSIYPETLISQADVIILALYPKTMKNWIETYQHLFKKDILITDVSGVKSNIVEPIQDLLRKDVEFISAHPMAGKETSGIAYANTEMFLKANYIITPTPRNTKKAIAFSYELANILKFNHTTTLNLKEHDHMIGFLSQLTHVIAVSLMNTHENEHLVEYTGDSFRDLTRIANINEEMWSELFLENKDILLDEIDAFMNAIQHFRNTLDKEDINEMKRLFIQSTYRRKKFNQ